jgi:hypothetical protein
MNPEHYPTWAALSYEFWAFASIHPFEATVFVLATLTVIGWWVRKD